MEPRHLYTIKWTQPYPEYHSNAYIRELHRTYEELVEKLLEDGDFSEARVEIERIMKL